MAQTFDAGHEETQRDLPGPLRSGSYPGIWALPATTLSAASGLALVAVLGFLLSGETSRALFRLPFAPAWAAAAMLLAWSVALACRNRPGRQPPRVWAVFLAAGSTLLTLACCLGGDLARSPYLHAGALAALAASVTLLPRLLPLRPDDWLVQHIAPLALVAVLFVTLPISFSIGRHAVADQRRLLGDTIVELSREAGEIRAVSTFPWEASRERREDALRQMQRLQALPLEQWLPNRYLWQGAAVLGEDGQLAASYRQLLDAVVAGIDPAHTPKLCQPQFNGSEQGWARDPQFPDLSAAVAGYHARTGQILQRLAPPPGEGPALRDLAAYYGEKKQEVEARLAGLAKTWNEDWVPPLIAAGGPGDSPGLSPLSDLLRRPLSPNGTLRPARLEQLLELSFGAARRLADPQRGCSDRLYREGDFQYFRIDCYAYAARLNPAGADLRVEMRVVYRSAARETLNPGDLPVEVYFLFPVPSGTDPAKYREDVMRILEAAVRAERPQVTMEGRSSASGFAFESGPRRRLEVTSQRIKDMSGEHRDDGAAGIAVRATYRER